MTVDVSELMDDPDFVSPDPVTLIRRSSVVNGFGENVLAETVTPITAIIQAGPGDMLERLPDEAKLTRMIRIWTRTVLQAESPGGYADMITWQGARWSLMPVQYWGNWGQGFTQALATYEGVSQ